MFISLFSHNIFIFEGFPGGSVDKESACSVGDLGSIPELGRSSGGGHGNPPPVFLPRESPWTKEPGGLQSMGLQRVDGVNKHTHTHRENI